MPRADRVFLPNKLKLEFPRAVIPKARTPGKSRISPFPPFPILHLVHGQVS